MGIDWFTFAAQIVNFLILIGLLWHFAYKPILRAMDERETSIRERLDEAEQKRAQSQQKARELDEQQAELDQQREDLLAKAREEAEQRRKELVAAARDRVKRSEFEWRESLQRQKDDLIHELERRAGRHVVEATRRILRDMADTELEAQIVDVFTQRLREIDSNTQQSLREAVNNAEGQMQVVSALALNDAQRDAVRAQLGDMVKDSVTSAFETDEALLCGIELRAGDWRIAWSVRDYLGELRERIETTITSAAETKTATAGATNDATRGNHE